MRLIMILIAALATGQSALWNQTTTHSADAAKIFANLVSFYEVPIVCPAVGYRASRSIELVCQARNIGEGAAP